MGLERQQIEDEVSECLARAADPSDLIEAGYRFTIQSYLDGSTWLLWWSIGRMGSENFRRGAEHGPTLAAAFDSLREKVKGEE